MWATDWAEDLMWNSSQKCHLELLLAFCNRSGSRDLERERALPKAMSQGTELGFEPKSIGFKSQCSSYSPGVLGPSILSSKASSHSQTHRPNVYYLYHSTCCASILYTSGPLHVVFFPPGMECSSPVSLRVSPHSVCIAFLWLL